MRLRCAGADQQVPKNFDRALARPAGRREPETFVDVGSGCGRLVLAASCVWPELARAAGVETCADLHMMAVRAQARASLAQVRASLWGLLIRNLPIKAKINVLLFLDAHDLAAMKCTSKHWRAHW